MTGNTRVRATHILTSPFEIKMSNDSPCISEGDDYESNYITDADSDSDLQHLTHREPSSPIISLEEAIGLVREGYYALVVWNGCYGGGPHLSNEGSKLSETLGKEGFDLDGDVILMEVLKRLGPEKATGPCSAFRLGLIEKRCERYIGKFTYMWNYDEFT